MTNLTSQKEKQLENEMLIMVSQNPCIIKELNGATQLVHNYAIASFMKKYAHEQYHSAPTVKAKDKILDIKQKEEETIIEMLKKDPTLITKVPQPSQLARNYAVAAFLKKYKQGR